MSSYQHLSFAERVKIKTLQLEGHSQRSIGRKIGRHHKTIGKELKRNHQGHPLMSGYVPELANQLAETRNSMSAKRERLKNCMLRCFVQSRLTQRWSPEQIARTVPHYLPGLSLSHEAIYQYVYHDYPNGIQHLARRRKQRYPRGYTRKRRCPSIPNRVDIDERPEVVNQRCSFGHWEADSIVCKQSQNALHVLHERVTRRIFIQKISRNTTACVKNSILNALQKLPFGARQSITYDNGSENSEHEKINDALGSRSYFCKPYHSWEKGAVENSNGLIRRYIPKGTNLNEITQEDCDWIAHQINNRPRKCLGFKTSHQLFNLYCDYPSLIDQLLAA